MGMPFSIGTIENIETIAVSGRIREIRSTVLNRVLEKAVQEFDYEHITINLSSLTMNE